MKIGLLAYHAACNFGANLQLLSTVEYLKKEFESVLVINWVPIDLEEYYRDVTPKCQYKMHLQFQKEYYHLTSLCRTAEDVANVIMMEGIQAVIIGSDAVAQCHPFISRISFPTLTLFSVNKLTEDRKFPNPFWGTFNDYLKKPIPIAVISASSQDTAFNLIGEKTRKKISGAIESYKYVSVRDVWTQKMFSSLTRNAINPPITPDPVFGFNHNVCMNISLDKDFIIRKFDLPEDYLLFSFHDSRTVSIGWLEHIEKLAAEKGLCCVAMPFTNGLKFENKLKKKIDLPLSPLEWYYLIKYSKGYIGHNMHPIVIALHNAVPFFSFDNYGTRYVRGGLLSNEKTSKIYHILSEADYMENRSSCINRLSTPPVPDYVMQKILDFDVEKAKKFADTYYQKYRFMMRDMCSSLKLALD
ncbi:polysaccharide pyruvyl transferase family protein [Bacteroides sp. GD17]|jgi:uncharacterized protein (DUF3820 family)|uniref:polysaccharide pyruvyl transferase family protein n=1 Tax=Bacteroides sp. GD17 TaxID=3139826 RepID=UPI00313B0BB7